jgi:hypothetical protein
LLVPSPRIVVFLGFLSHLKVGFVLCFPQMQVTKHVKNSNLRAKAELRIEQIARLENAQLPEDIRVLVKEIIGNPKPEEEEAIRDAAEKVQSHLREYEAASGHIGWHADAAPGRTVNCWCQRPCRAFSFRESVGLVYPLPRLLPPPKENPDPSTSACLSTVGPGPGAGG